MFVWLRDMLLGSEMFRVFLFRLRLVYYVWLRRRLRTTNSADAFAVTLAHNVKQITGWSRRVELLVRPLSVIETLPRQTSRVLVIGPRNEYDLWLLAGNGFRFRNLQGLDLITYSPKIDLGDMHSMPYADASWDAVLCGWTLSYSAAPEKAAAEMVRVVRDGGVIGVGVEYSTMTEEDEIALVGYNIQETGRLRRRVNSADEVLALFSPHVKDVFFRHDAPLKISHTAQGIQAKVSQVVVIFSVKSRP